MSLSQTARSLRKTRTALTMAAVLSAGALLLSACGGGSSDGQGQGTGLQDGAGDSQSNVLTYNFDSEKQSSSNSEEVPFMLGENVSLNIELPEELQAAGRDGRKPAVTKYTVKIKAFPSEKCRVDLDVTYADGGLDALKAWNLPDKSPIESALYALTSEDLKESDLVDSSPADSDLDSSKGLIITKDLSHITKVVSCNSGTSISVMPKFPYKEVDEAAYKENVGGVNELATAKFTTEADGSGGTTVTLDPKVYATVGVDGTWKAKS